MINEFEHLNLASATHEVQMNITNMRKACKKYLSEERFKPPPTKEELDKMEEEEERMRQMTGHQIDPDNSDEEPADDEWTWVML